MDLRDRDNFESIIHQLGVVGQPEFQQMSAGLLQAASEDAALDKQALELETKLMDSATVRKMAKIGKTQGNLRIHVFSQLSGSEWTLRISGVTGNSFAMSDFVSRVDFQLPSGETVKWIRDENGNGQIDGVTVTRPVVAGGVVEMNVHVNYKNCLYEVPRSITGSPSVQFASFVELFKTVCAYIKAHKLSSDDDPSYFTPDDVLHDLMYRNHPKQHPVSFASLLEAMKVQFKAPGPFKITHRIGEQEQIYDLTVQLPDPDSEKVLTTQVREAETILRNKLNQLDSELANATSNVKNGSLDAAFLEKLAKNPVQYMQDILEMPTGAEREVQSTGVIDYVGMATSYEFYKQPWAIGAAAYIAEERKRTAATTERV